MTYIDPNITFSPQVCNLAVGFSAGFMGSMAFILSYVSKVGLVIALLYLIKKLPEIIRIIKEKVKK